MRAPRVRAGSARSCWPSSGSPTPTGRPSARRCSTACAPRAPRCCAGPTPPGGCATGWPPCTACCGDPWPDVSDGRVAGRAERWWTGPFDPARNRADLGRIDAAAVLRAVLDWRHSGWQARRAGPGADRGAVRLPDRARLLRRAAGAGGAGAGGVRLDRQPRRGRRAAAGGAAPALPRRPPGRGHRRPGLVLGHRLPAGHGPSCAAGTRSTPGRRTRCRPNRPDGPDGPDPSGRRNPPVAGPRRCSAFCGY